MKDSLYNHLKNIRGWRSGKKIVVFSVDDYGNVRLNSKQSREILNKAGLKIRSRFDLYDTMETKQDLEFLYETLASVKDRFEQPAKFTAYSLPCNIDFEGMALEGNQQYKYENLISTFKKLEALQPKAYAGTWDLWKEGMDKGLIKPQFHGREHLNLKILQNKLSNKDSELMLNLANRSYTSLNAENYPFLGVTAAFSYQDQTDTLEFPEIIRTGINAFKEVYGFTPSAFTPTAFEFPENLEDQLSSYGIEYLDKPFQKLRHLGSGKFKKEWNKLGHSSSNDLIYLVRNVVFEPTDDRGFDWVEYSFKQIQAAFFWNKPANISSHRVNFCGHIDPENRKKGLYSLRKLLEKIVETYPEVEFWSADELGQYIKYGKTPMNN